MAHDRRNDAGQFRARTEAEVHADTLRAAINGRGAKHGALLTALGFRASDPLAGRVETTLQGGHGPQEPARATRAYHDPVWVN